MLPWPFKLSCGPQQQGLIPEPSDHDQREILQGVVTVAVIEGTGKRGSQTRAVAKRAGIPESGYEISFSTRLKSEVRPNAPVLMLKERTPYDFTVTWTKPDEIDGDGDGDYAEITHYAIEIATTSPVGTYYPWRELWCGAGHSPPDFALMVAAKTGDDSAVQALKAAEARRAAKEAADELKAHRRAAKRKGKRSPATADSSIQVCASARGIRARTHER